MSKIYVTNVHDVLTWLRADLDTSLRLPSAETYHYPYIEVVVPTGKLSAAFTEVDLSTATHTNITKRRFHKGHIGYGGRTLWVWEEI